jgi:O-antigen/teichoic acid export membrane protein
LSREHNAIMKCELEIAAQDGSGAGKVLAPISVFSAASVSVAVVAPPLRVSFSWTLAGNMVYAVTQFGMLSVLAKLGSSSIVGKYALGLAITAPVFMLTNLQLRGVQATDARNEYEFADYFTLRCLCTLVGFLLIAGIVATSNYDAVTKSVVILIALAKAIETFSDVIAGHLQKFERLDQVAAALMLRGLASVGTFALAFWITRSLLVSVTTLAVTWLIVICLYDFRVLLAILQNRVFFHFSFSILRRLAWLSLPLGIVMALNSLSANIPRYILEHKLGTAELGIFASLAYLVTAMGLISVALGQSACTRMARLFAGGKIHDFTRVLHKLLTISVLLGATGVIVASKLGKPVLMFVYRPEYAEHVNLLVVMVIDASVTSMCVFLGFGLTAARCFRSQIPIMVANVVATIVLTYVLLPYFGMLGGGYALLLSSVVQACGSYLILNRALHMGSAA